MNELLSFVNTSLKLIKLSKKIANFIFYETEMSWNLSHPLMWFLFKCWFFVPIISHALAIATTTIIAIAFQS